MWHLLHLEELHGRVPAVMKVRIAYIYMHHNYEYLSLTNHFHKITALQRSLVVYLSTGLYTHPEAVNLSPNIPGCY
jgi:hypothetical protein